jgi:hypothetical protein
VLLERCSEEGSPSGLEDHVVPVVEDLDTATEEEVVVQLAVHIR